MTQQEESANFFRLVRLLIDEGSDVLRDVLLKTIQPDTLTIFLQNNLTLINNLKQRKLLVKDQYDLLTRSPAVQFDELDITLLCSIFRNLRNISPTKGWQTPPGPTDLGLGDDIYRLRIIRNTIYGHTTTTRVTAADFQTLWTELKDVILRLAKYGTLTKQQNISQRITEIRSQDLDPKGTKQELVEILSRWMKHDEQLRAHEEQLEKHEEQLGNQGEQIGEHGDQLGKQEEQLEKHCEQLEKQDEQLRKHTNQFGKQEELLGKHCDQLETQGRQLGEHGEQLKKHDKQLEKYVELLEKKEEHLLKQVCLFYSLCQSYRNFKNYI